MWAVLPIKDFAAAKQRLAGVLAPTERHALVHAMFTDVLDALAAAPDLAGILVVAPEGEAAQIARRQGARVLVETEPRGLSAAVDMAMAWLAARGASGALVVPGDVPRLRPADIAELLGRHGDAPAVTIVPAGDEGGSNALACSPPGIIPLAYGPGSFARHCALARARGIEPNVVHLARLALDIDRPEDLRSFLARDGSTRTDHFLRESGIAARLSHEAAAPPSQPAMGQSAMRMCR